MMNAFSMLFAFVTNLLSAANNVAKATNTVSELAVEGSELYVSDVRANRTIKDAENKARIAAAKKKSDDAIAKIMA